MAFEDERNIILKTVKNFKSFYQDHKIEIAIFTIFFLIDLIYLSNTTANVPIMDYWRFGNNFLYDMFNGGIQFDSFWESVNGQRGILTYLLFFINVLFFHWNTRIAIFFGAIVTFITGLYLLHCITDYSFADPKKESFPTRCFFAIVMAMVLFNYVQWEIKVIEFSSPFSVNVLFVVFNMHAADRILLNLKKDSSKVIRFAFLLGISICFIFSAFFPAVVGAICICGAYNFFTNYKQDKLAYLKSYIIVGTSILIAALIYLYGAKGITSSDNNIYTFANYFLSGDFFTGMAAYLGSSIVHISITEKYGVNFTICIGYIIALLYGISIYFFFKDRRNKVKPYLPMMLILYTLLVGILLSYGRGNVFDTTYMCSSRYAYQSKLGLIGMLMILLNTVHYEKEKVISWIKNAVKVISISMIVCGLLYSQKTEYTISPYRRILYEDLIQNMYDIDNLADEELSAFQSENPTYVRQTILYMKMYRLGVFYNLPANGTFDQISETDLDILIKYNN